MLGLVAVTAVDLSNHRYISGDEPWIMSVSYNLARHGRFGSEIWTGFYHADQVYFISLPLVYLLQAAIFLMAGPGIAQARLVSVGAGLATLALVSRCVWRWYGLAACALACGLLLLGRIGAYPAPPGIPLIAMSRTARYDALAVAFFWTTVICLDSLRGHATIILSAVTGIAAGLAALSQFYGAFAIVLVFVLLVTDARAHSVRLAIGTATASFLVTIAPYLIYVALHWSDFRGQTSLKQDRYEFADPGFYVSNLIREYRRYDAVFRPFLDKSFDAADVARLITAGAVLAGILLAVWGTRSRGGFRRSAVDRVPWLTFVVPTVLLALLDESKTIDYSLLVVPGAYVLSASGWIELLRSATIPSVSAAGSASIRIAALAIAGTVAVSGLAGIANDRALAHKTVPYATLGRRIDSYLAPDATVIGADRWWWALRRHEFHSFWSIVMQMSRDPPVRERVRFADLVYRYRVEYVIMNDSAYALIGVYRPALEADFWEWLQTCTTTVADWVDAQYGPIRIYHVDAGRTAPICTG